jgi:hypothetical protein
MTPGRSKRGEISSGRVAFLRDPITVPRKERIEHYRAQAARYKQLAESEDRSSGREGPLDLARQCAEWQRR